MFFIAFTVFNMIISSQTLTDSGPFEAGSNLGPVWIKYVKWYAFQFQFNPVINRKKSIVHDIAHVTVLVFFLGNEWVYENMLFCPCGS